MRGIISVAMASVVIIVLQSAVFAELTLAQVKEAEALVKQCGEADYGVREAATKKLIAMGADVLAVVKKAAEETKDAEVKSRCELVAKTVAEQAMLAGLDPAKVTIDVKDEPLGEVLAELARKSGNQEIAVEGFGDKKVTLNAKDKPYWEAVDAATKSAGVYLMTKPTDKGTTELALAGKTDRITDVGAVAGPALVKIQSVQRSSSRFLDLRGSQMGADSDMMSIQMVVFLETKVPVMGVTVNANKVTAADGVNRADGAGAGMNGRMMGKIWMGGRFGRSEVGPVWTTNVMLNNAGAALAGPLTVEGTVELTYLLKKHEMRIEKLLEKGEGTATEGGRTLTVKSAVKDGANVKVSYEMDGPADETDSMAPNAGSGFGVALVSPEGMRHNATGAMTSQTTGTGAGLHTQATITFTGVQDAGLDWALVYTYPGKMTKREYPFKVEGVPTP